MLLYAKKSIFLSRDCHRKIKHCPKVTAVGIPIRRFSYLPSHVSCEYMFQRNKKITFHERGRRAVSYRRVSAWRSREQGSGMEGSEQPEKGKLSSELRNTSCDFCNAYASSRSFVSLKRVFSKIISIPGAFPLQELHVLMKQTLACESGQCLNPPKSQIPLRPTLLILFIGTNLCKEHAADL